MLVYQVGKVRYGCSVISILKKYTLLMNELFNFKRGLNYVLDIRHAPLIGWSNIIMRRSLVINDPVLVGNYRVYLTFT